MVIYKSSMLYDCEVRSRRIRVSCSRQGALIQSPGCSGYPEGCVHAVHAQDTGNGSPSCTWSPDLGLGLAGWFEAHTVHAQETGNGSPSSTWSPETPCAPHGDCIGANHRKTLKGKPRESPWRLYQRKPRENPGNSRQGAPLSSGGLTSPGPKSIYSYLRLICVFKTPHILLMWYIIITFKPIIEDVIL